MENRKPDGEKEGGMEKIPTALFFTFKILVDSANPGDGPPPFGGTVLETGRLECRLMEKTYGGTSFFRERRKVFYKNEKGGF